MWSTLETSAAYKINTPGTYSQIGASIILPIAVSYLSGEKSSQTPPKSERKAATRFLDERRNYGESHLFGIEEKDAVLLEAAILRTLPGTEIASTMSAIILPARQAFNHPWNLGHNGRVQADQIHLNEPRIGNAAQKVLQDLELLHGKKAGARKGAFQHTGLQLDTQEMTCEGLIVQTGNKSYEILLVPNSNDRFAIPTGLGMIMAGSFLGEWIKTHRPELVDKHLTKISSIRSQASNKTESNSTGIKSRRVEFTF